jgi:hypothetical protein
MIIGFALMAVGALLIFRNRNLAIMLGREPHIQQWGFMTSFVRQNIALIGATLLVGGLVFFVLF